MDEKINQFYDVDELGKMSELIRPKTKNISDGMLGEVYEMFRTMNLEQVEARRKLNQPTRSISNYFAIPIYGRVAEMSLTFIVSEDGMKLRPCKKCCIGFIRKRLDSIFN